MKIVAALAVTLFLSACVSAGSEKVSPELVEAVARAEQFVARHGFTAAGHPTDLPVQRISLYDGLFGEEQTLADRRGLLRPEAVCVRSLGNEERSVLFESAKENGQYWFVSFTPGSTGWLGHQPLLSLPKDCTRVPRAVP